MTDGDVRQLTRRVLNAYVAQTAADPRWAQIAYVTIVGVNPRIEKHREARRAAWARLICAQLDDLARRGRIPPQDPRLTVRAFIGAVNELVQTWCRMSPRPPLQEVAETLVHLLHSALTTPRPG